MLGSIIGDIAGSTYEFAGNKDSSVPLFPRGSCFTDDTVMLVATADALMKGRDFRAAYRSYGARFPAPMGGYGSRFRVWLGSENSAPYGSWGNGAAMRVAPVGWACKSLEETTRCAEESAAVTHNHPEGIKGATATAGAIWLARTGASKADIRSWVVSNFGYDLDRTCDEIRPTYEFNETAAGTVPEAIVAFLESRDFEHAIRLAISLGGDADTLACITGGIAQAHYREIPDQMVQKAQDLLDASLLEVVRQFARRIPVGPQ
jgi:ADP-ribosylglycohydrolase